MNPGFHHVELVAGDLGRVMPFYRDLLGLRVFPWGAESEAGASKGREGRVLYFGAADGRPGTLLAVRERPEERRGRWGVGGVHHVALGTGSEEALLKWKRRLSDGGVRVTGPYDRGYFTSLYFTDPYGQILEIATAGPGYAIDEAADALGRELKEPPSSILRGHRDEAAIAARTWPEPVREITPDMALVGLHHVSALTDDLERAVDWFPEHLGLELVKKTVNRDDAKTLHYFWASYDGRTVAPHSALTLFGWPGSDYHARPGIGQTRRITFRARDDEELAGWRDRLLSRDVDVSAVVDGRYHRSIRFSAPDGLPLAIATDGPGFGTAPDAGSRAGRDAAAATGRAEDESQG